MHLDSRAQEVPSFFLIKLCPLCLSRRKEITKEKDTLVLHLFSKVVFTMRIIEYIPYKVFQYVFSHCNIHPSIVMQRKILLSCDMSHSLPREPVYFICLFISWSFTSTPSRSSLFLRFLCQLNLQINMPSKTAFLCFFYTLNSRIPGSSHELLFFINSFYFPVAVEVSSNN